MSAESSFRKINYGLRPAKNIERKMMSEMLGSLAVFRPLTEYCYIGLGSVYFTDFALFHRQWGLAPMYSIEKDEEGLKRAEFNAPFSCIDVLGGKSEAVLGGIDFRRPSIVWLDYDTELNINALGDIQTVLLRQCRAGFSGVFLAITIDVESKRLNHPRSVEEEELEDWPDDPVEQFRKLVGDSHLPPDLQSNKLQGDEYSETCREVIMAKVTATVTSVEGWRCAQIMNFHYADGAEMATIGVLMYKVAEEDTYRKAQFDKIPYARQDKDPYRIEAPNLTFREMSALGRDINSLACPKTVPVQEEDFQKFKRIYRYFPAFVEAEL